MKRKIKMVEQTEHSECGLACATMILNYEGINISLNEIRDTFGVPRGGISLYHLIQVMTAYGIKCKAWSNLLPMTKQRSGISLIESANWRWMAKW